MRELLLTPGHSQWWLLSPGIMIYYDRISILKKDFDSVIEKASSSSYHARIANHLEFLHKEQFAELNIIDLLPNQLDKLNINEAVKLKDNLIQVALDPEDPTITCIDIFKILHSSFSGWLDLNKRKIKYLNNDEQYSKYMLSEQIPKWNDRLFLLKNYSNSVPDKKLENILLYDKIINSSLLRLIATSLNYMNLTHNGYHIYDPLLQSYMPTIELLEGQNVAKNMCNEEGDVNKLFEVFRAKMKRYNEHFPIDLKISDLWKESKKHEKIRKDLVRLDDTLNRISSNDLKESLFDAQSEVKNIVNAIEITTKSIDNGFWIVGLICDCISPILFPKFAAKISNEISNFQSISKGVGAFAGRYAFIADKIITAQEDLKTNRYISSNFNKHIFDNHYKPFSKDI